MCEGKVNGRVEEGLTSGARQDRACREKYEKKEKTIGAGRIGRKKRKRQEVSEQTEPLLFFPSRRCCYCSSFCFPNR